MTMVVARRYAVVIHAWCSTPPSLPTMVGIAVETMVWSRLESSMPAISAEKMIQIRFWVSSRGPAAVVLGEVGHAALAGDGAQQHHSHLHHGMVGGYAFAAGDVPGELGFALFGD